MAEEPSPNRSQHSECRLPIECDLLSLTLCENARTLTGCTALRALEKLEEAAKGGHVQAAAMAGMMRWQGEVPGTIVQQTLDGRNCIIP